MNYKRITVKTLSKIAVVLCAIIAFSTLVSTFGNVAFEKASELGAQLTELKEEKVSQEEIIVEAQARSDDANAQLPELKKAEKPLKDKWDAAEKALDAVCYRDYYSSSSWFGCSNPTVCKPLHDAASAAESAWLPAGNKVSNCEYTISQARSTIADANKRITEIEGQISYVASEKAAASWSCFFLIIAMLLAIGGLGLLSMFLVGKVEAKLGTIASLALVGASFIYMCAPTETTAFTYLLGILIFAIFAVLISGKSQHRLAGRVTVIIAAVLAYPVTAVFAPITATLFTIAAILISLVLVPCVFTEYLSIGKHIFFTIITLGIWHLIWMYNFTENLNKVEGTEERAPITELLLCALLPLYYIYWMYKTASNTEVYGKNRGKEFKIEVISLALAVINPLLASIIIQDKTNVIVGKPVKAVAAPIVEEAPVAEAPVAEEAPAQA